MGVGKCQLLQLDVLLVLRQCPVTQDALLAGRQLSQLTQEYGTVRVDNFKVFLCQNAGVPWWVLQLMSKRARGQQMHIHTQLVHTYTHRGTHGNGQS